MKMIDFVIPNNNEKEFIIMAERLGYKELFFLHNFDDFSKNSNSDPKIKIRRGILATPKNIDKINQKLKDKDVFIAIKSSDTDREIIEKNNVNLIFGFEEISRKDFFNQRLSGLDHILCKLAHNNDISIGFSFNSLLNSENKSIILGRMIQNINLCRKFKVKMIIGSFARNPYEMRSPYDLESLFRILGLKNQISRNGICS